MFLGGSIILVCSSVQDRVWDGDNIEEPSLASFPDSEDVLVLQAGVRKEEPSAADELLVLLVPVPAEADDGTGGVRDLMVLLVLNVLLLRNESWLRPESCIVGSISACVLFCLSTVPTGTETPSPAAGSISGRQLSLGCRCCRDGTLAAHVPSCDGDNDPCCDPPLTGPPAAGVLC